MTIAGITTSPDEAFMAQVARNLTDSTSGFRRRHRVLLCDRDTKFTARFRKMLKASEFKVVFTPVMAPNCNAYAKRFVLSIKSECLNRKIFFGEESLRRACSSFVDHYHLERTHQGIGNVTIEKSELGRGNVECHERLGGLLKSYRRAA